MCVIREESHSLMCLFTLLMFVREPVCVCANLERMMSAYDLAPPSNGCVN